MEVIETPWNRLGKFIELGFGIPFFIVGLFWFFQDRSVAFLYNGVLWIVVGLILLLKAKIDKYKLKIKVYILKCKMEIIWKSLIKGVHTVERLWKGEKFPEVEGIHLMISSGFLNAKKVNGMRSYYTSCLRKVKIR